MKRMIWAAALGAAFFPCAALAGPIEQACLQSERSAGNRAVCSCIQQVADMTLPGGDQRKAAKFFKDPERAQDMFLSKRASDDAFWDRYQNFGATAEAYCTAG
jgi:hypothetical protein